jgi:hypothetical protein
VGLFGSLWSLVLACSLLLELLRERAGLGIGITFLSVCFRWVNKNHLSFAKQRLLVVDGYTMIMSMQLMIKNDLGVILCLPRQSY